MAKAELEPTILVIFGISGDLAKRKLLPALHHLAESGLLHENIAIVGVTRQALKTKDIFKGVEFNSTQSRQAKYKTLKKLMSRTTIHQLDLGRSADYKLLKQHLDEIEAKHKVPMKRLYYLSIPPGVTGPIVKFLGSHRLNARRSARLLIEKPFGYDLESAKELITESTRSFTEEQIFRIDHYLAKETAQNIIAFRFNNPIFDSIWNAAHVQSITITAFESIGIEGRVNFYEQTGALRDLLQSHLLQILALVTMEMPAAFDSEAIHDAKLKTLKAIPTIEDHEVAYKTRRGQYETYRQEVDNHDSLSETYAEIDVQISSNRWRGVPIKLRTGKRMKEKRTEVVVVFRHAQKMDNQEVNTLTIRIQPNEGIDLDLRVKKPGFDSVLQTASMEFDYKRTFEKETQPDAYERVLVDAIRGDHSLTTTSQEVLETWRIVDNVLDEWAKNDDGMVIYKNGSAELTPAKSK